MYELNKIHNVDCMVGMKTFPDKFFELAIVDVPYGIGEAGQKNKYRGGLAIPQDYKPYEGKDREAPGPEYFEELFRISKNQIIFGANHFISRIPHGGKEIFFSLEWYVTRGYEKQRNTHTPEPKTRKTVRND